MFPRLMLALVLTLGLLAPAAALGADREDASWHRMAVVENGGPFGVSRAMAAATPEPGSALLLAAGGVVLALALRRRR